MATGCRIAGCVHQRPCDVVGSLPTGDMEELHMFADYDSWLSIETEAEANSDRFQVSDHLHSGKYLIT